MKNNIGAVVVHHKHYDTVGAVVSSLLGEGILAANVVVIDNSEEPEQLESLRASLVAGVTLIAVENKGYGAAVNLGVQTLAEARRFDYILVATHEVVIEKGAVAKLASALDNDPTVGGRWSRSNRGSRRQSADLVLRRKIRSGERDPTAS
ncbi:glycosyltransferase [Curtobacterium sp. MCJR17_043]|uniref:glycosyltransferase family 2 protein n=1 Tax=Curtobacterium sp. MCJR17_043 TaxID=2175660 RepID=UPI0024DF4E7E|nr:glycosyltransferase [Curtobacterium sp. MCJR17_043]WIB36518.1 glycosyltransferase [Curtobacterium sp. MCJR17_043]